MTVRSLWPKALVPGFVFACVILGGSTRSIWPNLFLQVSAVLILGWSILQPRQTQPSASSRHLWWLVIAMLAVIAVQLVPLPPQIWAIMPGRDAVVRGFNLLDQPLPWLPLSLTPYDTTATALWLLPPLAVIYGILKLGAFREQWLAAAIGLAALTGILLGVLQVTDVRLESPWYLYAITNNDQPVGTFANSNHMGTLLITAIPFIAAAMAVKDRAARQETKKAGKMTLLLLGALTLVLTLSVNGSFAAVGLAVPVVGATLLMKASSHARRMRWGFFAVTVAGLATTIAIFISPLSNYRPNSGLNHPDYSRYTSFSNSLRAAADAFPVGTGTGSFPSVYPTYEDADKVDSQFVNHVHNDYIELALETGLFGILLIVVFLVWWMRRAITIWRAHSIDYFARASTIASGAILAHSFVDYPLRTSAIAAVFAMCIALMAEPKFQRRDSRRSSPGSGGPRHLSV